MEIHVDIGSNDRVLKLTWTCGNDWSYRYVIPAAGAKFHSKKIREILTAMNLQLGRENTADYSHYVTALEAIWKRSVQFPATSRWSDPGSFGA